MPFFVSNAAEEERQKRARVQLKQTIKICARGTIASDLFGSKIVEEFCCKLLEMMMLIP